MRSIIDGHLDMALNALSYERDQRLEISEIREREKRCQDHRGTATVSLPAMRAGRVGLAMVTLLARAKPWIKAERRASRFNSDWPSETMAYAIAHGQLAYYRLLQQRDAVFVITSRSLLDTHWARWSRDPERVPPGIVITMEGADPILEPSDLRDWYDAGLRALSLAHFGHSRYAAGTPSLDPNSSEKDGPLTARGRAMLVEMEKYNMALDVTHLSDISMAEAFDRFGGRVYASHSNCRAIAKNVRQLTDDQIRTLVVRGGVIGMAFYNAMIVWDGPTPTPESDPPPRETVGLANVVDHIDHICQIAGNCEHVGIGSDLDGGFGNESVPREIDTIADLQKLAEVLSERGYRDPDIDRIFHRNWLEFWRGVLPPR